MSCSKPEVLLVSGSAALVFCDNGNDFLLTNVTPFSPIVVTGEQCNVEGELLSIFYVKVLFIHPLSD